MSTIRSKEDLIANVLAEFLEVAVHNILKIRKLYKDATFEKRKKYGIVVYQSIHPGVQEYISNCMKAVVELAKKNQLLNFVICFTKPLQVITEKIVFNVVSITNVLDKDPYLLEVENSFRWFFHQLHLLSEYLDPLEDDVNCFAVQITTKETYAVAYTENPEFQDFPWVRVGRNIGHIPNCEIVPLETYENDIINLEIHVEKKKSL